MRKISPIHLKKEREEENMEERKNEASKQISSNGSQAFTNQSTKPHGIQNSPALTVGPGLIDIVHIINIINILLNFVTIGRIDMYTAEWRLEYKHIRVRIR